jgi:hypothetical protein
MAAVQVIDDYVAALPGARKLDHGEWGITLAAEAGGGWPLDVGIRVAEGLVRVQAFALGADPALNAWNFLHWNRGTRMARFSCTREGDIWVQADLPATALDDKELDRLLGLVVEGALAARTAVAQRAEAAEAPDPAGSGGWGSLG